MTLDKKADRFVKADALVNEMRAFAKVTDLGRFMRWKEISTGRISIKFDIYEVNGKCIMSDTLGMVASMGETKETVMEWLKEHGYVPEKDFYMANGMTEEAWEEWNA